MDGGDAGVHLREYAYWQHALSGRRACPHRVRGDVIVRLSAPCIVGPNEQSDPASVWMAAVAMLLTLTHYTAAYFLLSKRY